MAWTWLRQQQQRGTQFPRKGRPVAAGEAPAEAVGGREVQDHDYADLLVSDGEPRRGIDYPASDPAAIDGDGTPDAPGSQVDWDDIVQPEGHSRRAGAPEETPLPEGK